MSHIQLDSKVVIEVCEKHLSDIILSRAQLQANTLKYEANKKRWFSKPWGYQKAFEEISKDIWHDFWIYAGYYWKQEEICNNLLILAKLGNPVTITNEHAYIFTDYVK